MTCTCAVLSAPQPNELRADLEKSCCHRVWPWLKIASIRRRFSSSSQSQYPETAQLLRLVRAVIAHCLRNTLLAITSLGAVDFEAGLMRSALAIECFPDFATVRLTSCCLRGIHA